MLQGYCEWDLNYIEQTLTNAVKERCSLTSVILVLRRQRLSPVMKTECHALRKNEKVWPSKMHNWNKDRQAAVKERVSDAVVLYILAGWQLNIIN